jgi:hypothetical protein
VILEFTTKSGLTYQIDESTLEWSTWHSQIDGKPVFSRTSERKDIALARVPSDVEVGKHATIICKNPVDNKAFVYTTSEIESVRRYERVTPRYRPKTSTI